MINKCHALMALFTVCMIGAANANPKVDTCRLLEVLGSNQANTVPTLLAEIAPAFTQAGGAEAAGKIRTMLQTPTFDGGSAWVIGSMGTDLEEHLILLRLREGEVAGARVRYEAFADGMSLVSLELQRSYNTYTERPFMQAPEAIDCS